MHSAIKVFGFGVMVILGSCLAHQPLSAQMLPAAKNATPALSSPDDWQGYPWPPDGVLTGTAALRSLLELPTAKGNACADYMSLTDMDGQPLPHAPLELKLEGEKDAAHMAMLKKLAADPEIIKRIAAFRSGAKKAQCQTFGVLYPWHNKGSFLHWQMPQYAPVMRHVRVALHYALTLAEQGKRKEAMAWLQDLVIVGWHLQQDVTLLANMVGVQISSDAAIALSQVLEAEGSGQKILVNAWRSFTGLMTWRRYAVYTGLLPKLMTKENRGTDKTLRMLIDIARSAQMMRGMRTEAMLAVSMAHIVRPGAPPASDLQKKAFEGFMNQALSYTLDLSKEERQKLAAENDGP